MAKKISLVHWCAQRSSPSRWANSQPYSSSWAPNPQPYHQGCHVTRHMHISVPRETGGLVAESITALARCGRPARWWYPRYLTRLAQEAMYHCLGDVKNLSIYASISGSFWAKGARETHTYAERERVWEKKSWVVSIELKFGENGWSRISWMMPRNGRLLFRANSSWVRTACSNTGFGYDNYSSVYM